MKRHFVAILLAAFAGSALAAEDNFESDADRLSYSLGMLIGERILKQYDAINYELVFEAMKAQHANGETRLSMEDANQSIQGYHAQQQAQQNAEVRMASAKFLEDNAVRKEVTTTQSGLQYEVLVEGEGPKPQATDTVKVHYRGTLIDGTEFDSSYSRNAPAEFPLNRVIPGWTEGVQLMSVGSKYRFAIPSELAYGERGSGERIPGGSALVFDVELLEIVSTQ